MKKPLILGLIVVALLAVIWFTNQDGQAPSSKSKPQMPRAGDKTVRQHSGEHATPTKLPASGLLPLVQMTKAHYEPVPIADIHTRGEPPFKFQGGGTSGKVVDREGHVLMESGKEIGIFGAVVGPGDQHVLIKGGDGINFVLTPGTGEKLQLPLYPPGDNMLGLGSWYWLGENTLFCYSGVQALDKRGVPVKTDNNVAETRLYVYDLTARQLMEVAMPAQVTQPVVVATEVMPDGHVHLFLEAPPEGTDPDLGWFKIDVSK